MTSKLTRERLEQLADNNTICKFSWDERIELAQIALAAMDSSESVELPFDYLQGHKDGLEWAAQLAEANHPETGDWLYDDPIELAKSIRKGPDMPPAQPAQVVPEGLRMALSNAGIAAPESDEMLAATHEKYVQALVMWVRDRKPFQPAQVVPDDVLDALQKVARIRLDLNDFDGDRRGIADCLCEAEEALIEVVNRRAAMLSGGKS